MEKEGVNMSKPKIGIVLTPEGVESITLLGGGSDDRMAANSFCNALKHEIADFEIIVRKKFSEIDNVHSRNMN